MHVEGSIFDKSISSSCFIFGLYLKTLNSLLSIDSFSIDSPSKLFKVEML